MRRGIISSLDITTKTAKVTLPDMDNIVSPNLKISDHIPLEGENLLEVGQIVIVTFFGNTFSDGAIIARI